MLHVPKDIENYYRGVLISKVPVSLHFNYVKWVRFYLDFCSKYRFVEFERESFSHFAEKLDSKGQGTVGIEESYQAISLLLPYYSNGVPDGELISRQDIIQKLIAIIRQKNYSPRTLEAYLKWCRQFLEFYSGDIREIDDGTVRQFLNYLVTKKSVSSSAHNQAFNALLFLFRYVLKKDFGEHSGNIRAKQFKKKIPTVLSRDELELIFKYIPSEYLLHFQLMYGCGLRLQELVTLRLQDFDFANNTLTVSLSKGMKSRVLPLPLLIKEELIAQKDAVLLSEKKHQDNKKYSGVFLPNGVSKSNAVLSGWMWIFPASKLTTDRETGYLKIYHIHHTVLSKILKVAVNKSGILKRVTPHTLRHTYATHLLISGFNIRTIQELMGHSSIKTTMIYLQVTKTITKKIVQSPLDINFT